MKELEGLKMEINAFIREYNQSAQKRQEFGMVLDRIEESLRQTYASLKRAQRMQLEGEQRLTSSYTYKTINEEFIEMNERLVLKLIVRMEFLMKNYLQYTKKEKDALRPVLTLSGDIKETVNKLKKKLVTKLFSEKVLEDIKILEILLLVEYYESLTSKIAALYTFLLPHKTIGKRRELNL
eukprot:TRINITY_DN1025_c0_g1_i1.p15 TRINITY_DN1025_c0_g1~~TRINITY_DN1025_c0_g1_i1.p15  ORF type:complete len:181 (+),score=31.04 TRINITY_DN1025_c0_g1_i1:10872-11414(+)